MSILEAAARLRKKEVKPVDLVRECLAAIDRREAEVRAWVFVDRDRALEQADHLARELDAGRDRGPLHGIPLGIKDIFDVADWPTTAGSIRWKDAIAREDAPTVARLRQSGAIFLGKTVTTAFASFDPPVTKNPWNLAHTPGGSSSGSAAGLATGMCYGALGSQTGGSITRPASYCGVCGLKPTYGLLPLTGVVALAPSMDHPGPMARSIADLRVLLAALAGPALRPASLTLGTPLRIGRCRGLFEREAEPTMREAMDQTVTKLQAAGIDVVDITLPARFEDVNPRHRIVMAVEAAMYHADRFVRHTSDYPPRIKSLIEEGRACPAPEYAATKRHQADLSDDMDAFLESGDISFLIAPATTGPAPLADTTGSPAFNSPWSYVGLPVASFPVARAKGLPLCVQIVGPRFAELDVLTVAQQCEAAGGAAM